MARKTITAKHMIISDACRQNHGDAGAVELALLEIKQALLSSLTHESHKIGVGHKFHIKYEVEREVGEENA